MNQSAQVSRTVCKKFFNSIFLTLYWRVSYAYEYWFCHLNICCNAKHLQNIIEQHSRIHNGSFRYVWKLFFKPFSNTCIFCWFLFYFFKQNFFHRNLSALERNRNNLLRDKKSNQNFLAKLSICLPQWFSHSWPFNLGLECLPPSCSFQAPRLFLLMA